jgi:hypothetical protein
MGLPVSGVGRVPFDRDNAVFVRQSTQLKRERLLSDTRSARFVTLSEEKGINPGVLNAIRIRSFFVNAGRKINRPGLDFLQPGLRRQLYMMKVNFVF